MRLRARTRVALVAGAVVVTVGVLAATIGPAVYRDVIVGAPDEAPTLRAPEPTRTPTGSATADPLDALPSSWEVAEGSYAGYRVEERLNGTAVTVTGRTRKVTGAVRTGGGSVSSARIVVDLRTIETNEPARDAYFRSTAIDTARYPTAIFTLTDPIDAPAGTAPGSVVDVTAEGTLELHGRERQVSVPMQTAVGARSSEIAGSIPIRFSDYGVTAPDLAFVTVQPTGRIEFLLELVPSS